MGCARGWAVCARAGRVCAWRGAEVGLGLALRLAWGWPGRLAREALGDVSGMRKAFGRVYELDTDKDETVTLQEVISTLEAIARCSRGTAQRPSPTTARQNVN